MARLATWLTALGLIGLAGFAAAAGLELARFALVAQEAEANGVVGRVAPAADLPQALAAAATAADLADWRATPGVQDQARALYLAALVRSGRAAPLEIEAAAADALAVDPTSSLHWLILAEVRAQRGAPTSAVLAAIDMSQVTGPREAPAMLMRARLLLRLWEQAPAEARRRAVSDLVDLRSRLGGAPLADMRAIIAGLPSAARGDLRDALTARLPDDQRGWLASLGL